MFFSQNFSIKFILFIVTSSCLLNYANSTEQNVPIQDIAYHVGKNFATGAYDGATEKISSSSNSPSFLKNCDNHFNALMSAIGKSLKSKEFKNLSKDIGTALSQTMIESTQGLHKGAKESTEILNSTLNESSKKLGQGMHQAMNNVGQQMQETYKAGGELDKGLNQGVDLLTRNINQGVTDLVHKNLIKTGAIFIGVATSYYIAAYGIPLCIKMIEKSLTKPKLIISSSKKSWKEFFFGQNQQKKSMVFSPKLHKRLNDIIEVTTKIHSKVKNGKTNVKYRNLMLYGPPGTGKTLFATELAQHCGLEYAYMSGSSFSKFKDGEGIEALDELFAWANKSNGLLIFIDEAETFLSKRENMDPQSKSVQLLNNFLNYTGTRSNKFMLVFATNHKEVLDSAMYRRIDDLIEIPLPGKAERINILNLYKQTILMDINQNDKEFINSTIRVLNSQKIEEIAVKTKGLSGGELEGIFNTLKTDADILNPSIITPQLVDTVVQQVIEKHKVFTNGSLLGLVED